MRIINDLRNLSREEYRRTMKDFRKDIAILEYVKSHGDNRPDTTVKDYIKLVGCKPAMIVVASMVNLNAWDGRIGRANAKWAESIDEALDRDACLECHLYTSMHMTHLDQIATVFRKEMEECK